MIRFARKTDRAQIIQLWNTIFMDSEKSIQLFLDKFLDCVLIAVKENTLLGMLSLIPISCNGSNGRYVYAVATAKRFRSRGIASSLLQYAKNLNEDFLLLVPAETSLFNFYKKQGFLPLYCTKTISVSPARTNAALPVKITPSELFSMRRDFFRNLDFFEWSIDALEEIYRMYDGHFYKGDNFFAVCSVFENTVYVKELCVSDSHVSSAISSLDKIFEAQRYIITLPKVCNTPSAMILGLKPNKPYFNLAMD